MSLLIRQARYVIRDAHRIERDVDLLIEGRHIRAIAPNLQAESAPGCAPVMIDGRNHAVIPGLINAHTHLYQAFLRGRSDTLDREGWLREVIYPFRPTLHHPPAAAAIGYSAGRLAGLEMLKNGTTSFIDMQASPPEAWRAWEELGIRGAVALTFADEHLPPALPVALAECQARLLDLAEAARAAAVRTGRLGVLLAPAAPRLCSQAFLTWAADLAERLDLRVQTHAAGPPLPGEPSPLSWLAQAALLNERTSLAQCTHLSPADLDLIVDSGATVIHCPKSDMKLGQGIAPVPWLRARGAPVALANDGPASGDLLDMFEEMRAAALLHKVRGDAETLTAQAAFVMATEHGARAAGLNAGTLDPGRLADLALIDLNRPHLVPDHDIVPLLVYCAHGSDVDTVIVDGQVVVARGRPTRVDEAEVLREARATAAAWLPQPIFT
ncbi:MAG: amidohydrolase [Anaerolineales bacterium]|nr:amidohydrolase [Anaerolineales bacterium]